MAGLGGDQARGATGGPLTRRRARAAHLLDEAVEDVGEAQGVLRRAAEQLVIVRELEWEVGGGRDGEGRGQREVEVLVHGLLLRRRVRPRREQPEEAGQVAPTLGCEPAANGHLDALLEARALGAEQRQELLEERRRRERLGRRRRLLALRPPPLRLLDELLACAHLEAVGVHLEGDERVDAETLRREGGGVDCIARKALKDEIGVGRRFRRRRLILEGHAALLALALRCGRLGLFFWRHVLLADLLRRLLGSLLGGGGLGGGDEGRRLRLDPCRLVRH